MPVTKRNLVQIILLAALCCSFILPSSAADASTQAFDDYIPTLLTPADQTRVQITRPLFTWTEIAGATGFKLKISTSPDFTGWVYEFTTGAASYEPTFDFPADKTFYWKVKPVGVSPSVYSDAFSFQSASPLVAPELDKPTDGSYVNTLTPLLRWQGLTDAVSYQIQIAADVEFTDRVISAETPSTIYLFTEPLDYLQTWYWRVRVVDADGDLSKWSPVRSFHTGMNAPVLLEPANGADVNTARPTFTWQAVDGATSYQLLVSLDSTFTEGTRSWSLTGTSLTPAEDLYRGYTLYWRVIAIGQGASASPTYEFESADPPSTPVIHRPQNSTSVPNADVSLMWSKVNRADVYEIQVTTDKTFATGVTSYQSEKNTYTLPIQKLSSGVWYWRIRAVSADGDASLWTATSIFSIR